MNPAQLQFLSQIVLHRCDGRTMMRLSWFIAASAALVLGLAWYNDRPEIGKVLFLLLVGGLGYLWCGDFLKSATRQNLPSNAVLVPGLRKGLMRMTALLLSACTLASAALGWLLLGHPGYVLLAGGLLSVFMLFANRYPLMNLLPTAIILCVVWYTKSPLEVLGEAARGVGEPLLALVGGLVTVTLGWLGLHASFPQGGDRHWAWRRCTLRQQARNRGETLTGEPGASDVGWLAWLRRPYAAALRSDSRPGADPARQMMHTLGPAGSDVGPLTYLVISSVVMALVAYKMSASRQLVLTMVACTCMQSVVTYIASAARQLTRRGGEQGLYLLTPAAPALSQVNRCLMRALMLRALHLWLLASACVVLIDCTMSGTLQVAGELYMIIMLVLPCTGLILRNYATMPLRNTDWPSMALNMLVMMLCIVMPVVGQANPLAPWFGIGSAIGLVSLAGLWWRWRHVMALPPVLPAGRHAA